MKKTLVTSFLALPRSVRWLSAVVAVTVAVLVTTLSTQNSAAENNQPDTPKGRAALTVTTVKPQQENWPVALNVSGDLTAWQEAVISSEIGGLRIVQVLVDVGDVVKRGQPLVLLSQEMVQADVRRQEANLAQAKASLDEARANAERAHVIQNSGALSAQQINQYQVAKQTATATVAVASAQLQSERLRLSHTRIVAPDDGVVSSRGAELGAVVSPGAELFRMVHQDRIEWQAQVSSQQLPQVRVGQKARGTLPGEKVVEGEVRMIAPTLNAATRHALVYVPLPTTPVTVGARTGMYVSGQLLSDDQPALTLPQSAIVLRDGNSYVYELGKNNRVTQRKVQIGRYKAARVEIVSGIRPTARIVQTGGAFLSDGDRVDIAALGEVAAK